MTVKWLRLALADLDSIFIYIAQDNPKTATRIVSLLWQSGQRLSQHPQIGHPGRVHGTRELVVPNSNYIIPYRVKNGVVQILRVLHSARQWPQAF